MQEVDATNKEVILCPSSLIESIYYYYYLGTCPAAGKDSAHSQRVLSHEEGYVGYDEGDGCK